MDENLSWTLNWIFPPTIRQIWWKLYTFFVMWYATVGWESDFLIYYFSWYTQFFQFSSGNSLKEDWHAVEEKWKHTQHVHYWVNCSDIQNSMTECSPKKITNLSEKFNFVKSINMYVHTDTDAYVNK